MLSHQRDLNPRPNHYEWFALPTELWWQGQKSFRSYLRPCAAGGNYTSENTGLTRRSFVFVKGITEEKCV